MIEKGRLYCVTCFKAHFALKQLYLAALEYHDDNAHSTDEEEISYDFLENEIFDDFFSIINK